MAFSRARVFQDEPRKELQELFDSLLAGDELRRVLDAGCGYELSLDFASDVHLVGIDLSAEALEQNHNVDEKIVGDIETYPLPSSNFDAIVCWWVLEHVRRPRLALKNMARSLRDGGLLVVAIPHLWSIKGLVTKLTPYGFHRWVYRTVLREPDLVPFKTYMSLALAPRCLLRIAAEERLQPVYIRKYGEIPDGLHRGLRATLSFSGWFGRAATLGRWDPLASDYIAVFRKQVTSRGVLDGLLETDPTGVAHLPGV